MTTHATTSQAVLIRKMMASHVFTDEERAGLERRLAEGFTRGTPSDAITWLKAELAMRKAAEREAAERQQVGLNL
ncbi:MAG TPA: hypothetical protein VF167_15340 [Longimicrobiaceae bacterium]